MCIVTDNEAVTSVLLRGVEAVTIIIWRHVHLFPFKSRLGV